jgi:hypothetical protein
MAHRFVGLVLLFSCSRRPGSAEQEATDTCLRITRAEAEYVARCEGGSAWWGSIDRAVAQLGRVCEAIGHAPGTSTTPADVEACVAGLATRACGAPAPASCRFRGSLPDGSACAYDLQCAGGLCAIESDAACGECKSLSAEGEACEASCDHDLVCSPEGRCVRARVEGEACDSVYDCERTLHCDAGTCRRLSATGDACEDRFDCMPGHLCDAGRCAARPAPAAPGAPCQDAMDCLDFSCVDGRCAAPPELGEACASRDATHPECAQGLVCIASRCAIRDARACGSR